MAITSIDFLKYLQKSAQVVRSLRTSCPEAPNKQFQNLALILKLVPSCFGVTQFLTTNLLKKVQNTKFLALF